MTRVIANERRTTECKRPRLSKGLWMKNRWDNGNTRLAKIYQFTQKSFKQNKKATINKIRNFSLNHGKQIFPKTEHK